MKAKIKKILGAGVSLFLIIVTVRNCTYTENAHRRFIRDEQGRALILHGVNINADAKHDPLRVGWPRREDYADLSEKWGFNFVRYLVLWDGIEPEPDKYDTAYFSRIRERLDWCQQLGLKVVLDMHQDLYALRFGGDGAPGWAIIDDGAPFEMQTPWELNYRQPAVIASINNFWDKSRGHPDLQEHYIKAFVELVKEFKDHPAVIGYDLYNEPTMATKEIFAFEKRYLQPFYEALIRSIRGVDSEKWIFFEPTALGPNQGLKSRLDFIKDPREGEPRLVYFPHIYTIDLDVMGKYIGFPVFISLWGASRNREIKRFNTPMLVGEFGLNVTEPGAPDYMRNLMKMLDKISSGWAYWAYMKNDKWSPFDENSSSHKARDILVRPYPRCVAGHPISYGYDPGDGRFWLHFVADKEIKGPTEIYIPGEDYPDGWKLSINREEKDWQTRWDEESRVLQVFVRVPGETEMEIVITPKSDEN